MLMKLDWGAGRTGDPKGMEASGVPAFYSTHLFHSGMEISEHEEGSPESDRGVGSWGLEAEV